MPEVEGVERDRHRDHVAGLRVARERYAGAVGVGAGDRDRPVPHRRVAGVVTAHFSAHVVHSLPTSMRRAASRAVAEAVVRDQKR